ncbi:MAG: hypothetical protein ACPHK8_05755 [Thermoplasmatota archaeon]
MTGSDPLNPGLVTATLTLPCAEIIKEELEGTPRSIENPEHAPVTFSFFTKVKAESPQQWQVNFSFTPAPEPAGAYFIPDTDYCHENYEEDLVYTANVSITPSWHLIPGERAVLNISSKLSGAEHWADPSPSDSKEIEFEVSPVLEWTVDEPNEIKHLKFGDATILTIDTHINANIPGTLKAKLLPLELAACPDGRSIDATDAVTIIQGDSKEFSTTGWEENWVDLRIHALAPDIYDLPRDCEYALQSLPFRVWIDTEELGESAVVEERTLQWALSEGVRPRLEDRYQFLPVGPIALPALAISLVLFRRK